MICEWYDRLPALTPGLRELSDFIHENPELGLEEYQAAEKQCALLSSWGFAVRRPLLPDLPTSFSAETVLGSGNGIHFGFFSEFDALCGLGHGCGHNLIAASGLAAFRLASTILSEQGAEGKLTLFGSPGEEGKGGKVRFARAGLFKNLTAALISHPYDVGSMDDGALSVSRWHIRFFGHAAHAGMCPQKGVNALDALISFFNLIGLWRQQIPESARVHGIITEGGTAVNVIPDRTSAFFYLRAPTVAANEQMEKRLRAIVEAAALGTGCRFEVEPTNEPYQPCIVNAPFNAAYRDFMKELGEDIRFADGTEGRGSTDFGDVSQLVPGANLHFGICSSPGTSLHTEEMRAAAFTDRAYNQAMKCACAIAAIAVRYFTDKSFRCAADTDFQEKKKMASIL